MFGQFIRFIGVGAVNTMITYLLYLALLPFFTYTVAYSIVYVFGIGLAYWLNLKYVFAEKGSRKKIILFPLVYLVQYLLGILILYMVIEFFHIPKQIGPILVVLISIPITFTLSKIILGKPHKETSL